MMMMMMMMIIIRRRRRKEEEGCKVLGIEATEKWFTHTRPSQYVKTEIYQSHGINTEPNHVGEF